MKLFAIAFFLSFFAALPVFSVEESDFPRNEIRDEQLTTHEETEALLDAEDEIIETETTVENDTLTSPNSDELTI